MVFSKLNLVCFPFSCKRIEYERTEIVFFFVLFFFPLKARIKRAKARKFEQNQLLQQQWDEKSKNIDKWQERLRLKIQEEVKASSFTFCDCQSDT